MPKTYNDLYLHARSVLKAAGIESFSLEARLLASRATGKSTEIFLRDLRLYTSDECENRLEEMLRRRVAGEPIPYIIGDWEFYGLPFKISPDVLIPRMDTEILVETALKTLTGRKMDARILDLCCGSGCIGISIAHELPAARVIMVDISERALEVSRENMRLNHTNRVSVIRADALEKPPMSLGQFDLIVSNPPYIPSFEIMTLDNSVRDFEPLGALDGGEDGLMFYRAILRNWLTVLRPGGLLMFEVGEDQAPAVRALMRDQHLQEVFSVQDTAGIDRVVIGRRPKE